MPSWEVARSTGQRLGGDVRSASTDLGGTVRPILKDRVRPRCEWRRRETVSGSIFSVCRFALAFLRADSGVGTVIFPAFNCPWRTLSASRIDCDQSLPALGKIHTAASPPLTFEAIVVSYD